MVIQAELIRKQTGFPIKACQVDKVINLTDREFAEFTLVPLEDYDFIKEFNREGYTKNPGVSSCILLLGEQEKDGILIDPQGYNYARYTAYIPNARQMVMLGRYPSLACAAEEMARLAERYVQEAANGQENRQYRIWFDEARENCREDCFHKKLFSAMLSERPEFEWVQEEEDEITVCLLPEYARQENDDTLRRLTQDEVDILSAKHTLWLHEAGGGQADFSNCLLDGIDLSHRELINVVFNGTKFVDTDLSGVNVSCCELHGAVFRDCSCQEMTACSCEFQDAEFTAVDLSSSVFRESNLSRAKFREAVLDGSFMQGCCIEGTDFGGAEKDAILFMESSMDEEAWTAEQTGQNLRL